MTIKINDISVIPLTSIITGEFFKVVQGENSEFIGKVFVSEGESVFCFDTMTTSPKASLGNPAVCKVQKYLVGTEIIITI